MIGSTKNKAQAALLLMSHDQLIERLDHVASLIEKQIKVEENFVNVIANFFAVEKKLHVEAARRKEMDENDRKATKNDNLY